MEQEHRTRTVAEPIAGLINPRFIHIKQTYTLTFKVISNECNLIQLTFW